MKGQGGGVTSVLGVGIEGATIAVAPVDREGGQLAPALVATCRTADQAAFLAGLQTALRRSLAQFAEHRPGALGVTWPGTVDAGRSVVIATPNLPVADAPLRARLEKALGLPVVLENHADAAVRAEATVGAAAGLQHVVLIALGTGVGGGLWLNGRAYRGANGGAGELGHIIVRAGGLPCLCGSHGCLEVYASGRALVRYAAARAGDPGVDTSGELAVLQEKGKLTGAAVGRLALAGDKAAVDAVHELSRWLGAGLVSITNSFDPEMVVVGGGLGDLGELLLAPARDMVRKLAMPPGRDKVRVESAMLGERAGMIGGALTAWQELGETRRRAGSEG